jgi:acyl-CoA synthetase
MRWQVRRVPEGLERRYAEAGWWDDRSLGILLDDALRGAGDRPFNVHSEIRPHRGTIGEVADEARRFASWLRSRGIGPGSSVLMQLPNWREAAITFWGTLYAGAVIVPVVHIYGPKELSHIVRATEPAIVVTPTSFGRIDYLSGIAPLLDATDAEWLVVGETIDLPPRARPFADALAASPIEVPVPVDAGDPVVVAFTSGTTRVPKGVIHSHRTLGFELRQGAQLSAPGGPASLVVAPVGHFIGMLSAFLGSLLRGIPINILDSWAPDRVLRIMLDEDVSLTGGVPFFFTSLMEHPDFTDDHLDHLPTAGLGGAPVPVPLARRLEDAGIAVTRCYGSTEHPTVSGCSFGEEREARILTDGHPLEGVELRLDAEGRISTRGPDLFLGYTDAQLTDEVFDADGWYRTGDVGVLDDRGCLTIVDRSSDLIIRGGENVSAREIEEELLLIPTVAEVAVVAGPDERYGERVVAVVRPRSVEDRPSLADVHDHLAAVGIARQKWPESLLLVTDFPRTPSGKVQKFHLRQQIRSDGLEHELE